MLFAFMVPLAEILTEHHFLLYYFPPPFSHSFFLFLSITQVYHYVTIFYPFLNFYLVSFLVAFILSRFVFILHTAFNTLFILGHSFPSSISTHPCFIISSVFNHSSVLFITIFVFGLPNCTHSLSFSFHIFSPQCSHSSPAFITLFIAFIPLCRTHFSLLLSYVFPLLPFYWRLHLLLVIALLPPFDVVLVVGVGVANVPLNYERRTVFFYCSRNFSNRSRSCFMLPNFFLSLLLAFTSVVQLFNFYFFIVHFPLCWSYAFFSLLVSAFTE